jgi:hypothetical protein
MAWIELPIFGGLLSVNRYGISGFRDAITSARANVACATWSASSAYFAVTTSAFK